MLKLDGVKYWSHLIGLISLRRKTKESLMYNALLRTEYRTSFTSKIKTETICLLYRYT